MRSFDLRKILIVGLLLALCMPASALNIRSYYSPRNRERPKRKSTSYIILHTTEGPKTGSLKKVHRNGETHYFVDTAGRVYRIISRDRVALHAGRSLWNGRSNLDDHSVGIEVVGYHNRTLTAAQIKAVKELLSQLQGIYKISDDHVLTHSMVAYGAPNRWHRRSHRGRKRCGMQFARRSLRLKLGLTRQPLYDPDVRAGRLVDADPYLTKVLYGSAREQDQAVVRYTSSESMVIGKGRSAWDIARDHYRSADTTYVFPDGKQLRGNQVRDWGKIPVGTRVILGSDPCSNESEVVKVLGVDGDTAIDLAGDEYKQATTIYFLPNGMAKKRSELSEDGFKRLPAKTRVLVGYELAGIVTARKSAFDICGERWNFPGTFYHLPGGGVVAGDRLDERTIPKNARVFMRK